MSELPIRERVILAIDTSEKDQAERLARIAKQAGARFVKLGLELSSANDWRYCSDLAARNGLDWVADAKLADIPNTIAKTVKNIVSLDHRPFGITMHAFSGDETMRIAQETAGDVKMLGVTILTSMGDAESIRKYGKPVSEKVLELAEDAARVKMAGVVSSAKEVGAIKSNQLTSCLFTMIPGTRSEYASTQDQVRVATPGEAIADGADLLVIGRQITQASVPEEAYEMLIDELTQGLSA